MLFIHTIIRESVLKGDSLDALIKRWKASGGDGNNLVALVEENGGWKEPDKENDEVALDWFEEDGLIPVDYPERSLSRIHYHSGDRFTESQLFII